MTAPTVFYSAPTLYLHGSYVFFGGRNTDIIAKLDGKSYKWSKLGKLKTTRPNSGVILVGDTVFVVGGKNGYGFRTLLKYSISYTMSLKP